MDDEDLELVMGNGPEGDSDSSSGSPDGDDLRYVELSALRVKLAKVESQYSWSKGYSCLMTILLIAIIITTHGHIFGEDSQNPIASDSPSSILPHRSTPSQRKPVKKAAFEGPCLRDNLSVRYEIDGDSSCQNSEDNFQIQHPSSGEYGNNERKKWCIYVYSKDDVYMLKVSILKVDIEPYDWVLEHRPDTHVVGVYNNGGEVPSDPYGVFFEPGVEGRYCIEFQSDSEKVASGFALDMTLTKLNGKFSEWSECDTVKVTSSKAQWNGQCGIGFRERELKCESNDNCISTEQQDYCNLPTFCTDYKICDIQPESRACEEKSHAFNGVGRVEPSDPHVFTEKVARNKEVTYNTFKIAIEQELAGLSARHLDERALTYGVTKYKDEIMANSRRRLGLKLARSLLMGKPFILGTTGSSNTAGHDNMYISSYPVQLQSILKPFWEKYGVEGASFTVRNAAIGGKLGTESQAFCVHSQVGEDADVVMWESFMNDGGRPSAAMLEVHLRNANFLPNRPLWHTLHAGTCDRDVKVGQWSRYEGYRDIKELAEYYDEAGVGNIHFRPCQGLEPLRDQEPYDQLYITWHPDSQGHRAYAEVIAYEYLTALQGVLEEHMDEILQEAGHSIGVNTRDKIDKILAEPTFSDLPSPYKCGSFCEKPAICITGLQPLQPQWSLERFVRPETKWEYRIAAHGHDVSGFDRVRGEQGPLDHKWAFVGGPDDGWLRCEITIPSKGLWIHKPYADHSTEYRNELITTGETLRIKLDGKSYKCESSGKKLDKMEVEGCFFEDLPQGKHILEVKHDEAGKLFAIHLIATW